MVFSTAVSYIWMEPGSYSMFGRGIDFVFSSSKKTLGANDINLMVHMSTKMVDIHLFQNMAKIWIREVCATTKCAESTTK